MKLERYVILSPSEGGTLGGRNVPSLGEVDTVYDKIDDARADAETGDQIVALIFEMVDSELVEVA